VELHLGWKGPRVMSRVPQLFDLWQDPQERYDIVMNNTPTHLDVGHVGEKGLKS